MTSPLSWFSLSPWLMLVVVGPLTYAAYVVLSMYRQFRRRAKYIEKFPGAPRHWLMGHLHLIPGPNEAGLTFVKASIARPEAIEGAVQFWYGPFQPAIGLFHPNHVRTILKTSEPKPRGIGAYFNVAPWLGDGLLLSRGPKWARNRRLLTPAFNFDILRPYMNVNNSCSDVFMNKLQRYSDTGEYFEVFNQISLLTLDIILRCAFSYEIDCQTRSESDPYVSAVHSLQGIAVHRGLHPYLYPDIIFYMSRRGREFKRNCEYVHQVSTEIIKKRKATLQSSGSSADTIPSSKGRYLDFLDILLTATDEDGQGLTDSEIRDEVDTFLFEGHDTTASGISWTLYSLAANPEHQKLCQQEIDELLAGRDNDDIEWDDLPGLKYLTMCLKESLRLHTPVPFIQRETTQDMTIANRHVPAGSLVDIHLYMLHHNPNVWDSPEEYIPDRFSDENSHKIAQFAFVPFSAGPRNCIGQHFAMHEMKTVIAKVLRRFTLSLDENRPVKHGVYVVMKTENGMYMKATRR